MFSDFNSHPPPNHPSLVEVPGPPANIRGLLWYFGAFLWRGLLCLACGELRDLGLSRPS
jgi:hypothetical protein